MNCPSCHGAMQPLSLKSHFGMPLEIDLCAGCQLIWFDRMESTELSPTSVIELFRRIHQSNQEARQPVATTPACPRCAQRLLLTRDLVRAGSFSYHRCPAGDGRLISFTQFLREKNFIRSLNPAEITRLAVSIKQIRCSSCGAPVNLETDTACSHCGSPISVLDEQAVQKALADFADRPQPRVLSDAQAAMLMPMHWPPASTTVPGQLGWSAGEMLDARAAGGALVDLVGIGIAALFD